MALRLGHLLVNRGVITEDQRANILDEQRITGRPFGELAENMFGVSPKDVEAAWAEQYASLAEWLDPREEPTDPAALNLITRRQAWQFGLLPLRFEGEELRIATTQEHLVRALGFSSWGLGVPCYFVLAKRDEMAAALMKHYPMQGADQHLLASSGRAA
ncbi:MAG: hypothetical protein JNM07_07595 [Phycisphaerae bacterium]|nr:hypothetical protein [Phycisphaerae bacterium]